MTLEDRLWRFKASFSDTSVSRVWMQCGHAATCSHGNAFPACGHVFISMMGVGWGEGSISLELSAQTNPFSLSCSGQVRNHMTNPPSPQI